MVTFSFVILLFSIVPSESFAHRSGCHRWHTCPSDTGSYGYVVPSKTKSSSSYTSSSSTMKSDTVCKGTFESTVKTIVDGDTLYVKACKKSIRLSLVDTPERGEDGFSEAKSFTQKFCKVGSKVKVDQDNKQTDGSYGRLVAKVYCSNTNLNEALLTGGYGELQKQFCSKSESAKEGWAKRHGCL